VECVEDLLARGIDLLILNPLDPKALVLVIKSATRAGVPVIIIDSSIDLKADFITTIQSNNLRNGQKEAFEMIMKGDYGATGLNNPVLIADMAVDVCVKVLAGERDFPRVIYTPAVCISGENVDQYYDPDAIF
jgi:ABC-type sugar transport system substrate-binding protein